MSPHALPQSVLIVDDQPAIALSTEIMLVEIGIQEVVTAGSVSDALSKIEGAAFDLAVLDFNLGLETGWLVAQRLCDEGVRMVVTTDRESVTLPAACGTAPVLRRPYDLNILAELVSTGSA